MNQRVTCYVAAPITIGDRKLNVANAIRAGVRLMETGLINAYVPHFSYYLTLESGVLRDYTLDQWLEIDFVWLGACDALLRLPGESRGAEREVAFAIAHNIPVFLTEEAVLAYARGRLGR